ncbi:MAG: TonB-dependent receptor [Bacteroidia bacterium]|nr:TonB-dependent receptor [Bacteroidia bacterium]
MKPVAVPTLAIALLAFTLLPPSILFGQTASVRGRVTSESGEPLIGANVVLRGTVLGSATDADGRYFIRAIPPQRKVTLTCSMIGYRSVSEILILEAGEERTLDLRLAETTVSTGEVIVTAGKHAQSFEEIPVSISVLSGKSIEERGIIELDDALRKISGVNITEDQVNIRGSSGYSRAVGSRVLLLVDGAPVLAGDAGEIKFDAVPMFNVERIEVVKGAGSALYGSSALGGVINVITSEPRERSSRLRLYTGMWDEPKHAQWKWWGDSPRFSGGVDVQHGDAAGSLSYLLTAGLRGDQGYREIEDFTRWNFGGRAWYRFSPDRNLSVNLTWSSNDRGNWVFWRDLSNALRTPEDKDKSERIHSTKMLASAQYRQTHSGNFASSLRLSAYRTAFDTRSDTSDFSFRPADRTQSTAWQYSAEWQGSLAMSSTQLLTFGADFALSQVNALIYGKRSGYSGAVYAQDELRLHQDVQLSAGARFDVTSIDTLEADMQVNPRLGLTWQALDGTAVRASYGWGFRSPSIAERFATVGAGGLLTKPNPGLKAERSTSYEVGATQRLPWRTVIDAAIFWNDYENLVEPTIDPVDGRIVFRNITEARIRGYELSVQTFPWEMFDFSVAYTYLYPEDRGSGTILKYRPRHLFYVSGSVDLGPFRFGVDHRIISRLEEVDMELSVVIPDADRRVPTYVTDLRLAWSGAIAGLPVRVTALTDNILNYSYTEVVANLAPIRQYRLMLETTF